MVFERMVEFEGCGYPRLLMAQPREGGAVSYFHSFMTYGIIFCGNSPHSSHIFRLQKRVIRIITNSRSRDPVRE
jgi:hypothetical protein